MCLCECSFYCSLRFLSVRAILSSLFYSSQFRAVLVVVSQELTVVPLCVLFIDASVSGIKGSGIGSYSGEGFLKSVLSAFFLCILFPVEVFCRCKWLYVPTQHLAQSQCLHSNVKRTTISWTMPEDLVGSFCNDKHV